MPKLQTRICRVCGEERALKISFYKKERGIDGYDTRCKECHCDLSRERLRNNYNTDKEKEKYLKRKSEGKHIINGKKMIEKYPDKYIARYTLRNAVAQGKIEKLPCEVCGLEKSEAHHEDYSKPLEVIWLCKKHHGERHRKIKLLK